MSCMKSTRDGYEATSLRYIRGVRAFTGMQPKLGLYNRYTKEMTGGWTALFECTK
jgi:hypothetical protein